MFFFSWVNIISSNCSFHIFFIFYQICAFFVMFLFFFNNTYQFGVNHHPHVIHIQNMLIPIESVSILWVFFKFYSLQYLFDLPWCDWLLTYSISWFQIIFQKSHFWSYVLQISINELCSSTLDFLWCGSTPATGSFLHQVQSHHGHTQHFNC